MQVKIEEITKKQTILVVDDNKDIVHLFKKILSTHGYMVNTAENGHEALKMALENPPDLILLDLAMPKMDGYTVCKKLKESDETKMIPVIMVTCRDTMKDKIQGLKLGADDYITKPIYYIELLARVESLLKLRELQKQLIEARKLETLAQIAVSVNHEINNPLCSISANAEMLRSTIDTADDSILRKIDIILKEVDRIKHVISKLSNATRVISMEYISGVRMLDLNKSVQSNEKNKSSVLSLDIDKNKNI